MIVVWALSLLLAAPAAPAKPPLPYVGLDFRWMDAAKGQKFLHVERVAPNGPAARGGIRAGDRITHIGGVAVDFGDELDFLVFISDRKPNERLRMKLLREGRAAEVVVTLGTLPEAARPMWERGLRIAQQRRLAARGRAMP